MEPATRDVGLMAQIDRRELGQVLFGPGAKRVGTVDLSTWKKRDAMDAVIVHPFHGATQHLLQVPRRFGEVFSNQLLWSFGHATFMSGMLRADKGRAGLHSRARASCRTELE